MRKLIGTAILTLAISTSYCLAEEALENDLSRGQLFAKYILPSSGGGGEILSLDRDFIFPDDVKNISNNKKPVLIGIDISHHNVDSCDCSISWPDVFAGGARFVYIKASQGRAGYDKRLEEYVSGLNSLKSEQKIYKGYYHFLSADGSGSDQADWYVQNLDKRLAIVAAKREKDDLPPVLDVEWDHRVGKRGKPAPCSDGKVHRDCWELVSPDEIVRRIADWLQTAERSTGRKPVIYTSHAWVKERIKDETKLRVLGDVSYWPASYLKHDKTGKRTILTITPSVPNKGRLVLWQYSDRSAFPDNVNLNSVDANIYKGNMEQFKADMQIQDR